jgi:ankyrin repeat protein
MEALVTDARAAIEANDEAALRDAIRRGADVNGMVPCANYTTGARGLFPLFSLAASKGLAGMCEILLAAGADANIPSTLDGSASLQIAAYNGSTACVRLLLRAGAHMNARGNDGATALHAASYNGHVHAAKLLIAAGANFEARNQQGTTPLRFAIARGHREVALTLLRAGAPITVLPTKRIKPANEALQDYMVDIIDTGGWNARVERHRRPLMSILSNLALPRDALLVVLSFWSPPGGR